MCEGWCEWLQANLEVIYKKKLMNNENKWTDKIAGSKVVDAVQRIDVYKVQCAINNMKNRKASEPPGIALKILKVGGESCLKSLTIIFNILFDSKSPKV